MLQSFFKKKANLLREIFGNTKDLHEKKQISHFRWASQQELPDN